MPVHSRRHFLQTTLSGLVSAATVVHGSQLRRPKTKAQIAITLDLEMSAQYPRPGMTEWNYQKGNLDEPTKQYAVEAARIVRQFGGRLHFFCVGRVLEQPDIDWLQEIAGEGHPIGNHTYDHVNVLAKEPQQTQFRFQRSPWLVAGKSTEEIIRENVRLTTIALKERAGIEVNGFRTPGGFHTALTGREDVQNLLKEAGFSWVSSKYPPHLSGKTGEQPGEEVYESIVEAQKQAQPFRYPNGVIEIPMSPISDVTAFRSKKWKLDWFLEATRRSVAWAIDTGQVFDFLAHPSCLVVEDPKFEIVRLICETVKTAGDRAEITTLDRIAAGMGEAR